MKKSMLFIVLAVFFTAYSGTVYGQSISITQITPSSPADLAHEEEVTIHFDYTINEPGGARIFIRPMTAGSRTPNYAASGSQVYQGSGNSTANFTITSGDVTVDQLRVQVIQASGQEVLAEFLMPVDFTFSGNTFQLNPNLNRQILKQFRPNSLSVNPSPTRIDSIPADAKVLKRTVKPDGTVEIYYSGGFVRGRLPGGGEYIVSPAGDTTRSLRLRINVQEADEPVPPMGIAESADPEAQKVLLSNLDKWLTAHSERLMNSITLLVTDEEALQNFKDYEQKTCDNIYDRINLRYSVLERLTRGDNF